MAHWMRSPTTSKASPILSFTRSSFGVWPIESSPMSCWLPEVSALYR